MVLIVSSQQRAALRRQLLCAASAALLLTIALMALCGCADYSSVTRQAHEEYYSSRYTDAAKKLEQGAHREGVNQLLYLFDRATALHQASQYDESNQDFHLADKIAEIKDYTSLAKEAATLVSNDRIIDYKGEDFEKVLISQYLALNYLMLQKYEDALVECRRVNHKLHMMITEGKRKYKLNPMASYLSALIYEDSGEWNDAYVDYQAVRELIPEFHFIGQDLYRLAWRNKIREDALRWAKDYNLSVEEQKRIRETADQPEIILLVENGRSPEKHPHPAWSSIPKFYPRFNPISYADVLLNGEPIGRTEVLFDIETTAIENLDEKYAKIIAKKIAGVVAKEVIADQVGQRTDPLVGALLRVGLYVADQADLRSWQTLPKDFQIFRVRVEKEGSYTLKLQPRLAGGGLAVSSNTAELEKLVHFDNFANGTKGHKAFIHIRM